MALGKVPLQNYRFYNIIKFWTKIILTEDKKLINVTYKTLYRDLLEKPNCKNWCSLCRDLFSSLGVSDAWYYQTICDAKIFLSLAKQQIHDQFYQNWAARLNNSTHAVFYKSIAELKFQPYLQVLNIAKVRTSLSQLRVSSHKLCIETGRWNKPVSTPFNDQKCSFCNVLEDEYHFVIQCQFFFFFFFFQN